MDEHRRSNRLTAPILFTRLENSLELFETGGEVGRELLESHYAVVRSAVDATGGQDVKWVRDGLMVVFQSAGEAVRCAVMIQQAARRLVGNKRLRICIAVHVGDIRGDETDYFSSSALLAQKLCGRARVGQILCSVVAVGLLSDRQAFEFRKIGELALAGAAPVTCFEVVYDLEEPLSVLAHMPFVGRVEELTRLRLKLREVEGGNGAVVIVSGEAGIGKTRLASELAEAATREGALVLQGACYEGDETRLYGPFVDVIRDYAREANVRELRKDLGPGAAVLLRVVPELRGWLEDLPEAPTLARDEERHRFLDVVAELLGAISGRRQLVIVLDDLHWAESGTVALLRHVARCLKRARVLVVGTYGDDELDDEHPLFDALGELYREASCDRLHLTGLADRDVAALLATLADQEAPAPLVSAIQRQTGGNPFFVGEVLRHLVEEKALLDAAGRWRAEVALEGTGISEGARQVVRRRLARLSADARRLITAGAGFNLAFALEAALKVAGLDRRRALDALDEALHARLLRPASDPDCFEFTHPILRHALYQEMSPARRVELHREIAETLGRLHGEHAGERAGQIAHHYKRSAPLPGAERGVPYALIAADLARSAASYEVEAGFLGIAEELLPAADPRRARILGRLGTALCWALRFDEALKIMRRAGEALVAAEGDAAAADYLAESALMLWAAGSPEGGRKVAKQGLGHVGERRDLTWVRLMANDVIGRRARDAELPGVPLDDVERREIALVAERCELGAWDVEFLTANAFLSFAGRRHLSSVIVDEPNYLTFDVGDYRRGAAVWEERGKRSENEGRIAAAVLELGQAARCYNVLGEFPAARQLFEKARVLAERLAVPLVRVRLGAASYELQLTADEGWDGLLTELEPALEWMVGRRHWGLAVVRTVLARTYARLGRDQEALGLLRELIAPLERSVGWQPTYAMIACHAAWVLWLLGRTDWVAIVERNLREKVLKPNVYWPMEDARLSLARLSALQGRYEEATEWLGRARAVLDKQGARPLRAIVDYDEALIHLRSHWAPDSDERAAALLDAAGAEFEALRMPGWLRSVAALRGEIRSAFAAPTPRAVQTDGNAFVREGEYWTLAFAGKVVRVKDAKGLRDVALLLANPGRDFHVTDLLLAGEGPAVETRPWSASLLDAGLRTSNATFGDTVLDSRARAEYRGKLNELRHELEDAEQLNDIGRAARIRQELELIGSELASAYGLSGRTRVVGNRAERARKTVTSRIHDCFSRIKRAHPALGQHLAHSIKTGILCCYQPDEPVHWNLSSGAAS